MKKLILLALICITQFTKGQVSLQLKIFIEGFYLGNGSMRGVADLIIHPNLCDTLIVELHNLNTPYGLSYVSKGTIDISGNGIFTFPLNVQGNSYYVAVRHRNSLEAWSATPILFNNLVINYDFTDAIIKAFGNNLKNLGDGKFALFSGNVNSDIQIDSSDINLFESAAGAFLTAYNIYDLNGDGLVESVDYSLLENNLHLVVQSPIGSATVTTICNQTWMVQNLDVDHYRNGDPIPKVTDLTQWIGLTTGAYCYYNNDSAAYAAIYGKLYNWYAVNDPRGIAPLSLHVPSEAEWTTLVTCLGGDVVAGGKMKESGTTHWHAPNGAATNSSGFTGLPGGGRNDNGTVYFIGDYGVWWSSTESGTADAWLCTLNYSGVGSNRYNEYKRYGFSVRCLRD